MPSESDLTLSGISSSAAEGILYCEDLRRKVQLSVPRILPTNKDLAS